MPACGRMLGRRCPGVLGAARQHGRPLHGVRSWRAAPAAPWEAAAAPSGTALEELQRCLGSETEARQLLAAHPEGQETVAGLVQFLDAYGVDRARIADLFRSKPQLMARTSSYEAGLLFQELARLGVVGGSDFPHLLVCGATAASAAAMAAQLREQQGLAEPAALRMCLARWPELLAAPADTFAARAAFLAHALGPPAALPRAVQQRLWDGQLGWVPAVADWAQRVQPCLDYLEAELGVAGADQAAFLRAFPVALAMPVFPLSDAAASLQGTTQLLAGWLAEQGGGAGAPAEAASAEAASGGCVGSAGRQVASLLVACPAILAQGQLRLRAGLAFLVDVVGGGAAQLLAWPPYLAADLDAVLGPRYCFLHQQDLIPAFSDAQGDLDLGRAFGGPLEAFLAEAARARGAAAAGAPATPQLSGQQGPASSSSSGGGGEPAVGGAAGEALRPAYGEAEADWQRLMGSSAVAALSGQRPGHAARLNALALYLA